MQQARPLPLYSGLGQTQIIPSSSFSPTATFHSFVHNRIGVMLLSPSVRSLALHALVPATLLHLYHSMQDAARAHASSGMMHLQLRSHTKCKGLTSPPVAGWCFTAQSSLHTSICNYHLPKCTAMMHPSVYEFVSAAIYCHTSVPSTPASTTQKKTRHNTTQHNTNQTQHNTTQHSAAQIQVCGCL